jgi:hypothetical protein
MAEKAAVILAKNLRRAMAVKFDGQVNQSLLSRRSGVSQKTISNILSADEKSDAELAGVPSTTLRMVEQLAQVFGMEAWMLLHPGDEQIMKP